MRNQLFEHLVLWPARFVFGMFQILLFAALIIMVWFGLQLAGVMTVQVPVTGASMLPTLPEEGFVPFRRYGLDQRIDAFLPVRSWIQLGTGDIVVFENTKTHEELDRQHKNSSGFVKRIIGMPGDTIMIRDGFVYRNGKKIEEPYILKPRSTFGGSAIRDCREITVPPNSLYVLGDNRKVSMDSRQIGLIDMKDVSFFIPFARQESEYGERWRDTSGDFIAENTSLFDVKEFVQLLNNVRRQNNLKPLSYQPKLEASARLRAEKMIQYDEFDSDGKKSGYTMRQAMADAGYSNIVYGEFPMTGYYDTQELYEAFMEQQGAKQFLLNAEYQEIGVSTFIGEIDGCPMQVVVQHLAGYVPPNYTADDIMPFQEALVRLEDVRQGWGSLKDAGPFYDANKADIDRLNEIIALRITRFTQIVARMKRNEWLSDEERKWSTEDAQLSSEQNSLAQKLNALGQ